MGRNIIVITVEGDQYKIEKNGISDFALIGVLECLVSDLKSNRQKFEVLTLPKEIPVEEKTGVSVEAPLNERTILETSAEINETIGEVSQEETSQTNEIRNRIKNARKAIRELDGEVEETDLYNLTDEELQVEFEELTAQYKRLKSSQVTAKTLRK
ncbi:MAG TPA: hypothetical protein PKY82_06755 [Pyrinomonadaceae bacterium]|nr:hypothetical protein [Pyrinomonadaceae bacterium]